MLLSQTWPLLSPWPILACFTLFPLHGAPVSLFFFFTVSKKIKKSSSLLLQALPTLIHTRPLPVFLWAGPFLPTGLSIETISLWTTLSSQPSRTKPLLFSKSFILHEAGHCLHCLISSLSLFCYEDKEPILLSLGSGSIPVWVNSILNVICKYCLHLSGQFSSLFFGASTTELVED